MNETASYSDIQQLSIKERIQYYEQELSLLARPATFRDKVLINVYRCLLQSSLKQDRSQASFTG